MAPRSVFPALLAASLSLLADASAEPQTWAVGGDVGWSTGVVYPKMLAKPGDTLEFAYTSGRHDVWKVAAAGTCDFGASATALDASVSDGNAVARFEIPVDAPLGEMHFACGVGSHCLAGQEVTVLVVESYDLDDAKTRNTPGADATASGECSSPTPVAGHEARGRVAVSCLSPPVRLAPGGVVDDNFVLPNPYPTDRRVVKVSREAEFVRFDGPGGARRVVPLSELYVHHFVSGVIAGEGAELKHSRDGGFYPIAGEEFAELSPQRARPFANLHLIDLRGVSEEDRLPCLECRCQVRGKFEGFGGIFCCSDCPSSLDASDVAEYFLAYTAVWEEPPAAFTPTDSVSFDVARALGETVEYDVSVEKSTTEVVYEGTLTDNNGLMGSRYQGPEWLRLLRCVAHQHIGGLSFELRHGETGETLCRMETRYGTQEGVPGEEKGFLVEITQFDFEEPVLLHKDTPVRVVSTYEKSLHVGVMGLLNVHYADGTVQAASLAEQESGAGRAWGLLAILGAGGAALL